jgi:hypothetical protein
MSRRATGTIPSSSSAYSVLDSQLAELGTWTRSSTPPYPGIDNFHSNRQPTPTRARTVTRPHTNTEGAVITETRHLASAIRKPASKPTSPSRS